MSDLRPSQGARAKKPYGAPAPDPNAGVEAISAMKKSPSLSALALDQALALAPVQPGELTLALPDHQTVTSRHVRMPALEETGTLTTARHFAIYRADDCKYGLYEVSTVGFATIDGAAYPDRTIGFRSIAQTFPDAKAANSAAIAAFEQFAAGVRESLSTSIAMHNANRITL